MNLGRIGRGAVGLVVLVVLAMVVSNWWGDFRSSPGSNAETTSTIDATATPSGQEGSGQPGAGSSGEGSGTAPKTVTVLIEGLNFRAKPDSTVAAIRGLKKGEKLTLIETQGDWYHVKTSDGKTGWVSANSQYTSVSK